MNKVNRVDGSKVKDEQPPLADAFDGSPQSNWKQLRRMIDESTQYNIGDVIREINLPTFALAVMRKAEVQRFNFEKIEASIRSMACKRGKSGFARSALPRWSMARSSSLSIPMGPFGSSRLPAGFSNRTRCREPIE